MSHDKLFLGAPFKCFKVWTAVIALALGMCAVAIAKVVGAQTLDDGSGAFHTGRYRDLFAEQGHSPAETKAKLDKAFQQLFHGDPLSERVYFEAGSNANGPLAYITDWANNDARTEGMSYGMMIAVQMDKKREFDALWNWSNTHMLITDPKNPNAGYFAWSMNTDGTPRATGPAPDGEEYFCISLLFAARRWGNGEGIYNYQGQADKILHLMRHHPVMTATGPFRIHPEDPPLVINAETFARLASPNITERLQAQRNLAIELKGQGKTPPDPVAAMQRFFHHQGAARPISAGPMVEEEHHMVRFVPDVGPGFTDASYHLPAFYELFARWGPAEDRDFWLKAAEVSRDLFSKVTGPNTGLSPDRSNFDMSTVIQGVGGWDGGRAGQPVPFGYDSWRTASNWSVDYSWWHKDPRETVLSDRIQAFLIHEGISTFADRYTLDGKPLSSRHSIGMVAATAVGGLAATPGPNEKAFVEELWRTPIPVGDQRYFDGMLYMMSMLHCSGNFRIWEAK
ncbi:MAG TPA: glycosyl hydrolase family 8 [Blastocatellia bacterium]|nr:glycosyl hydrolase family 8 [Blastocatellia bacterium]